MTVQVPQKKISKVDNSVDDAAAVTSRNVPSRLVVSLLAWFVVILVSVDFAAGFFVPKKSDGTAHKEKLESFFKSDRHPELLLLGSSVALASCYTADKAKGYVPEGVERSKYLELVDLSNLIFERTGKRFRAGNLSLFGSMTSDTWMTASKTVEFKKTPKIAIYETVSRDLFDASMPPLGESPYYRYLSTIHPKTNLSILPAPLVKFIDEALGSKYFTSFCLLFEDDQIFTSIDRARKAIDSVFCSLSNIYGNRVAISSELANYAGQILHRGTSVHNASLAQQIENKKKNLFGKLTDAAPGTFEVNEQPQLQRYERERVYFAKLLRVCKDNNIKLIVVNMPTREGYKALVPNGLRGICPKQTYDMARKSGFDVIDLDNSLFTADDYVDLGHLNAKGAVKLNVLLAEELAKRRVFDGLQQGR